ncbi:hypothetical protein AMECASPLE_014535 [Ameca splendens]|uniref:Uncharacterized protein n=1 Tax=Ameca splendens TaxID=208324 RepID=A0ABV0XQF7_9TELE
MWEPLADCNLFVCIGIYKSETGILPPHVKLQNIAASLTMLMTDNFIFSSDVIDKLNNNNYIDLIDLTMEKLSSAFNPSLREQWAARVSCSGTQSSRLWDSNQSRATSLLFGPKYSDSVRLKNCRAC